MKSLSILLLISYVKGGNLSKLYLPPIGANDSGGLSGDIEVPFEVHVQKYFGTNESLKLMTEQEPDKSFYGIGPSTRAPSVSSVTLYDAQSIIPVEGGHAATKDVLNTPKYNVNEDYERNQFMEYNNEEPLPITNYKNDIANIDSVPEISKPSSSTKEFSNYKGYIISPISNKQYVPNFDYFTTNVDRVIRPQTEADRNAIVINDKNVITPEVFSYSYDTSNGIHADESGTATDGVEAHGSYSFIGDDGKLYNVTYTADVNGFRPRGDHLPTAPPIPEAILKVIEQAARDESNGIFDDGSYDDNKYGYKKYEKSPDRFSNSISSTRRFKGNSNKPENNTHSNIGNSRVENYIPTPTISLSYIADGKNDNFNKESSNYQDNDDDKNLKTVKFNEAPNNINNQKESEIENAFNRDLYTSDSPNIRENNRLGYKYFYPKNKFLFRNNIIPESSTDFGIMKRPVYVYDKFYTPESDINQKLFLTRPLNTSYSLDKNKDLSPNPITDDRYISTKNSDIDKFGQPNPSRPSTGPFSSYTSTPLYLPQISNKAPEVTHKVSLPSSTERIIPVETYTDRPSNFYGPSSTERINQLDSHTDRPSKFYGPSSTERINHLDSHTDRPSNFYGSSSTERINQLDAHTVRPSNFYEPSSTERINQLDAHSDRPSNFYGPSSTERIIPVETYTDRPSNFYGPSSTEIINQLDSHTDRPSNFYGPSSTERINHLDSHTDRPSNFYGPSSTERINQLDAHTVRPSNFYGPSSTERINQLDAHTVRPSNFYGPSSTERINQLDAHSDRPNNFYGPSSTERTNRLDSHTDRPSNFYGPSSTERINHLDSHTDRPSNFYGPSSTEIINQLDAHSVRPSNFYGPSSTERINQLDAHSNRPSNFYEPSSIEIMYLPGTYTDLPRYFYGIPSTDSIKEVGTYANRKDEVYGPSSTERINPIGKYIDQISDGMYTDGPNGSSSTERIIDENFAGPKQSQSYNPQTGYYY